MLDRDYSFGTIGFFIRQAKEKGLITLYGNGQTKRTFTSMEDLCSQIVQGVSKYESLNQTYNVGGRTHTLFEAALEIASLYDARVKCVPFPEDDLRIESGSTYFDSSKIEKLLGIKSFQDIDTLF
jgi:UDP-glucose 4-epimerase